MLYDYKGNFFNAKQSVRNQGSWNRLKIDQNTAKQMLCETAELIPNGVFKEN